MTQNKTKGGNEKEKREKFTTNVDKHDQYYADVVEWVYALIDMTLLSESILSNLVLWCVCVYVYVCVCVCVCMCVYDDEPTFAGKDTLKLPPFKVLIATVISPLLILGLGDYVALLTK